MKLWYSCKDESSMARACIAHRKSTPLLLFMMLLGYLEEGIEGTDLRRISALGKELEN